MITYTYIVKCPHCEDEFFDFFDEAKEFALSCLSSKPIITQTEVNRNDFGECTDHCDLGTVWSWEDVMKDTCTDDEPAKCIFTKDDLVDFEGAYNPENDPEFYDDNIEYTTPITEDEEKLASNSKGDYLVRASSGHGYTVFNRSNVAIGGFDCDDDTKAIRRFDLGNIRESRKPIPEGMTIEELVEAMEENEDTVECTKCGGLFEKATCTHNKEGFGWCCTTCEPADTLVEAPQEEYDLATLVADSINHLTNDLGKDPWADDFADDVIADLENNYDIYVPEDMAKYGNWCHNVASEVSRQVNRNEQVSFLEELEDSEAYRKRLELCPECGATNAFDHETGICLNCGFNI